MPDENWIETYRGVVFRWEVDAVDHMTVAYYLQRFGDSTLKMLHALGLGPAATLECFIHYRHELRVNDVLHVESAVIGVEPAALVVGHRLLESSARTLCTTVEQRLAVTLTAEQRRAAEARRAAWDGPQRELRPRPTSLAGFTDSSRDTVKASEVDPLGRLDPSAAVHRYSAANGHVLAAFGLSPRYMRENQRGFSTFEFQLGFEQGVRAGDPIRVQSALTHVGNSSMRILHVMTNEATGARVSTLEQSGVQLDLDARRPAPLSPELRARAATLLVPAPA